MKTEFLIQAQDLMLKFYASIDGKVLSQYATYTLILGGMFFIFMMMRFQAQFDKEYYRDRKSRRKRIDYWVENNNRLKLPPLHLYMDKF